MPEIYGVKTSLVKTKKFQKANFKPARDLLRSYFDSLCNGVVMYNLDLDTRELVADLYNTVGNAHPEVASMYQLVEEARKHNSNGLYTFYQKCTSALEVDDSINKLVKEFQTKHPLLECLRMYRVKEADLLEYLNRIPAETQVSA